MSTKARAHRHSCESSEAGCLDTRCRPLSQEHLCPCEQLIALRYIKYPSLQTMQCTRDLVHERRSHACMPCMHFITLQYAHHQQPNRRALGVGCLHGRTINTFKLNCVCRASGSEQHTDQGLCIQFDLASPSSATAW